MPTSMPFFDGLLIKNSFLDVDRPASKMDPQNLMWCEDGENCPESTTGSMSSSAVNDIASDDVGCQSPSLKFPTRGHKDRKNCPDSSANSCASQQGSVVNDLSSSDGGESLKCPPPCGRKDSMSYPDSSANSCTSQQGSGVNDLTSSDDGECQSPSFKSPSHSHKESMGYLDSPGFCQQGELCSLRYPACSPPFRIDIQAESLGRSQ